MSRLVNLALVATIVLAVIASFAYLGLDLGALFASGAPALVIVAGPNGGEQIVAEGDGTLSEPGRYAIVCFIPTGADPEAYFAAAATADGPPQVEGGAPHLAHGMYAELLVG